jgi:predicted transcriptional regulator
VPDIDYLKVMNRAYKPALPTTEIADEVGISQPAASKHLKRIQEEGLVDSDKVGQARIWWITDTGKRYLSSHESQ